MNILLSILMVLSCTFLYAASGDDLKTYDIQFTTVPVAETTPTIDGDLSDPCWEHATVIDDFVLTAGDEGESPTQQTICRLLYDDTHLYVAFQCKEKDIQNIKAACERFDDLDILYDDRVEVFLDLNHDHRSYYEMAVNPAGVQFDQTGYNRLQGSKTCDFDPDWNAFWRAKTTIGSDEWIAEIMIDLSTFGVETLVPGMTWGLNLARVRQPDIKEGGEFFKREPQGAAEYSAWALTEDTIRETISNFHAPLHFGDLVLGDPAFEIEQIRLKSAQYAFGPLGTPSTYGWNPLHIMVNTPDPQPARLRVTVIPDHSESWQATESVLLGRETLLSTEYWIPEELENKIVIEILDKDSQTFLYRTSYTELVPPFIEFNLEPLYTRQPQQIEPVQYRLLTDARTANNTSLQLVFREQASRNELARVEIENPSLGFAPVFDINDLRKKPGGNYVIESILYDRNTDKQLARFEQHLTKFANTLPERFYAEEGEYSYGGITDHAIRVRFPFSAEFVFWKKASYIPIWDVEQAAMTNEFVEAWGGGNQGCNEPMQDRETRYTRVKLVENSPARVKVHWRYALTDPHYNIYFNEWVDEYYVLYPDGVGGRQVNLWPNTSNRHESFEVLLAKPPGVQTQQLFDPQFATLNNLMGEGYSNIYLNKHRDFHRDFIAEHKEFVVQVHFKDRLHPFTVFALRDSLLPGTTPDHVSVCARDVGHADRRGHWPASRFQIDGYNTPGLDVPHHGNIGNVQAEVNIKNQPTTWVYLTGVAEENSDKPFDYAKSWLYPGSFEIIESSLEFTGFSHAERAFLFNVTGDINECQMKFKQDRQSIINPVLIFSGTDKAVARVELDGKTLDEQQVKTGFSEEGDSIAFLQTVLENDQIISITFK